MSVGLSVDGVSLYESNTSELGGVAEEIVAGVAAALSVLSVCEVLCECEVRVDVADNHHLQSFKFHILLS